MDGLCRLRGAVSVAHEQPQASIEKNPTARQFRSYLYDPCEGPGEITQLYFCVDPHWH